MGEHESGSEPHSAVDDLAPEPLLAAPRRRRLHNEPNPPLLTHLPPGKGSEEHEPRHQGRHLDCRDPSEPQKPRAVSRHASGSAS